MENVQRTLAYLETLSTADLISLADEYGLEIPEYLNRRFIISELLDIADEINEDNLEEFDESEVEMKEVTSLPDTYNETKIDVVLKNPVWTYVYWDISAADLHKTVETKGFIKFLLKVCFWDSEEDERPCEVSDISVSSTDRAQYIFLPIEKKLFSIDLVAEFSNVQPKKLASSRKARIPTGAPVINLESIDKPLSPILELSGMRELIKSQYENHRQSFTYS